MCVDGGACLPYLVERQRRCLLCLVGPYDNEGENACELDAANTVERFSCILICANLCASSSSFDSATIWFGRKVARLLDQTHHEHVALPLRQMLPRHHVVISDGGIGVTSNPRAAAAPEFVFSPAAMSATPSSEESFFDGFTVPTKAMFSRWVFVGKFFRFVGNSPADARTRQFALRSCSLPSSPWLQLTLLPREITAWWLPTTTPRRSHVPQRIFTAFSCAETDGSLRKGILRHRGPDIP